MDSCPDPALWSTTRQAAAIVAGELGSVELLDAYAARIDRLNPTINAVCTLDLDRARSRAGEADRATAAGQSWGPLHGIPITIKDAIETEGIRSTGGATALRDHVPARDATVVESLKNAGAIVMGKTNLPEWSSDYQSFNEMFGTTNNPWDLTRVPGGSSGGAAAAVAAGLTSFEIGTDIGGSIRLPSAFCGVFGHKPSHGVVPTLGYLDAVGGGLTESDVNVFGPIARTADDLRLVLDVIAGPAPDRAQAWRLQLPPCGFNDLRGVRIAAWLDDPALAVDASVVDVLQRAAGLLDNVGAHVDHDRRPALDLDATWRAGARLIGDAVSVHDDGTGPIRSHPEWLRADRERARVRLVWAEFFRDVDVLLCPVTLVPAFAHLQKGDWRDRTVEVNGVDRPYVELEGWPALIGAAYLPSTVAPVGFTESGLPVGMQVVSPYLHDLTSITVAGWLTDLTAGYRPPPMSAL